MFDVGFAEIFLLTVVGLLVLGPERLPAVARTLGGLVRKARSSWYQLRRSIETELAAADVADPIKAAGRDLREVSRRLVEAPDPTAAPGGNAARPAPDGDTAGEPPAGDGPTAP